MQNVVPALRITDYESRKKFYVEGLGFHMEWEHRFRPDFPVFMSIRRDDMRIFLTQHSGDCQVGGLVHFYVDDADAWYREFIGRGITIENPPDEDIPGTLMFTVTDLDGNQLRFVSIVPKRDG